jgi:hypothetical protein
MQEQTRLQEQELGHLYTLKLQDLVDNLNRLIAGSVRDLVSPYQMVESTHYYAMETIGKMVSEYPQNRRKIDLQKSIDNTNNEYRITGYHARYINAKQNELLYFEKYLELNNVLLALCSLALDNPDDDAYKIISEYKKG